MKNLPGVHLEKVSTEFKRITTIHLQSKLFSELDVHSANLMKVYAKKGGVQGKKIKTIMAPITQTHTIEVRRECILKGLCVYLNEDPEKLVKQYLRPNDIWSRRSHYGTRQESSASPLEFLIEPATYPPIKKRNGLHNSQSENCTIVSGGNHWHSEHHFEHRMSGKRQLSILSFTLRGKPPKKGRLQDAGPEKVAKMVGTLEEEKSMTSHSRTHCTNCQRYPIRYLYLISFLYVIGEKLNVGFTTRATLNRLLEAGEVTSQKAQQFQQAALAFLVRAVEYAMDKLPLKDALLKHARFIDVQLRAECGVEDALYFVDRFQELLPFHDPKEQDQVSEEFMEYQLMDIALPQDPTVFDVEEFWEECPQQRTR
ncbi:hypothetical protein G5714_004088 [Onychostoma macrolepis]|uniref:Uncharacterized protein n=1 Tax=Onychostoma macrolepis TaxID=369639 RepID=A0A7J6DBL6_9TELE|nr:hypothetical protein G5714_004088 [Onychostoma macrolepis]